jgi:mono/diheme cytochrome c family protein
MNGGQKMPAFRESVSDEEAAQLVAWLRAKHRPVAPAAK